MNEPENATDPAALSDDSTTDSSAADKSSEPKAQDRLLSLYKPIQDALAETERQIKLELSSKEPKFEEFFSQCRHLTGKRMRPALTLLCAQVCGGITPQHIVCATVMELIHTASLVHDDVLDEAKLRRHEDTINARWDNEKSVLFGDLIVSKAMKLAASLENIPAFYLIADTSEKLCEGEMHQEVNRGKIDLDEALYYKIIEGKTAALIECACRLGALFAGAAQETVDRMGNFGLHLGTAFQIIDDLLDVSGNEKTVGKTLGQDLKKQKSTLAIIYALQCVSEQKRIETVSTIQDSENPSAELMPWLKRTNALEFARKAAEKQVDLALEELEKIDCPETGADALESLKNLAEFVLSRKF
ncbi:MAG: polyprenyl synthetase family protein [Thermoguttaceae bacterium]|nr:polyprenyl synthetase family protein [Thermoguttaceae bacterium]